MGNRTSTPDSTGAGLSEKDAGYRTLHVKSSDSQTMVNNAPHSQNISKSNILDEDSALLSVVLPGFNEAAISRGEAKRRPLSLVKERLGFPSGDAERETAE